MVARDDDWSNLSPGERFRVLVPSASTNGAFSVMEFEVEPGYGVPLFVHKNEEKHFIIIDGKGSFVRGDEIDEIAAGSSFTVPRGVPHAWTNPPRPRYVC